MDVTFSIIVPTMGRDTLVRTLASVAHQLKHGDEILVQRLDCLYGNEARDRAMAKATGTHLLFIDDDDAYVPDALATIRQALAVMPDRIHIFRMKYDHGLVLWYAPALASGNIGTPMVVIPNEPDRLAVWAEGEDYLSDFAFINKTANMHDKQPVFHEEVVALVRPEGLHPAPSTAGKEYASG